MGHWFKTEHTDGIRDLESRIYGLDSLKKNLQVYHTQHPVSILDIGSAEGLISDWLLDSQADKVVAIEGDIDKVLAAKKINKTKIEQGNFEIIHGNANDLNKCLNSLTNTKFEVVLLLAILQKLDKPLQCLRHAVAKASKYVAIRVPDYWFKEYKSAVFAELSNWQLITHVHPPQPDDLHQGHLLIFQQPGLDNKLDAIRKEIRTMAKTDTLRNADFTIVSFPKSGRTWVRFFLAKYLELEQGVPFDLELMPQPYWTQERTDLDFPKIHFTHDWFDLRFKDRSPPNILYKGILDKKPVVFLMRNPMDTMVSYYYHKVKRESTEHGLNMTLDEFLLDDIYGLEKHCAWMDKMLDYLQGRDKKLIISYEDMIANLKVEMLRLFDFIGIEVNQDILVKTIDLSSFNSMQQIEIDSNQDPNALGIGRLSMRDWDGSIDTLKVRKGQINGWQSENISQTTLNKLNNNSTIKIYLQRLKKHYIKSAVWL